MAAKKKVFVILGIIFGIFVALIIIGSLIPEEDKKAKIEENYIDGITLLETQNYEAAKRKFDAVIAENANYKDVQKYLQELKPHLEEIEKIKKAEATKTRIEESLRKIFGTSKEKESGIYSIVSLMPECGIHYNFFPLGLFKFEQELGSDLKSKIKKAFEKNLEIQNFVFMIRGPFDDKYGNTTWLPIVSFQFPRSTYNKINWDNFLSENLLNVSENVTWFRRDAVKR